MKKVLIATAILASAVGVFAQGTINFNNKAVGTLVTHVYGPEVGATSTLKTGNTSADTPSGTQTYTGTLLAGTGFTAQLWAAPTPGGGQPESSLQAVTAATTTFRTGSNAGFIQSISPDPAIPGVAGGQVATLQLRAWDNGNGSITSYGQALIRGASPTFTSDPLGGGTVSSPFMTGLQTFNIATTVPEPTTVALGVMGLTAFLIRRRK